MKRTRGWIAQASSDKTINGIWSYISYDKVGYETYLARSADLLHWEKLGKIMSFPPDGWDRWQAAGGVALCDPTWGGSSELQTYDGKYWMSYIGGGLQGFETDPLSIGIAWTKTPTEAHEWTRIAENPVLSIEQCPQQLRGILPKWATHEWGCRA